MATRRRGFTLIELLVVIAIIGILAAMVFPVFARARESARKTVCLSNVKNIALAIQMYLADNNDTLPPEESRPEVQEWFDIWAVEHWGDTNPCLEMPSVANPYLQWAVALDEYTKNRDVWRCPSAKVNVVPGIIWGDPDWFSQLKANAELIGGEDGTFCVENAFPSGWGGEITDSFAQLGTSTSPGMFVQSITCNQHGTNAANARPDGPTAGGGSGNRGLKLVSVEDPVRFVICGDSSTNISTMNPGNTAYPDLCALACAYCSVVWDDEWWDWSDCAEDLEPGCEPYTAYPAMITDPNLRKPYARHLGGVNLGFLDGHASWWNSERLLAECAAEKSTDPLGLYWRYADGGASWCVNEWNPGTPTLW